jgi:hypothetical protein
MGNKIFLLVIVGLFLTGCVYSNVKRIEKNKFNLNLVQVEAISQVDESFVRKMIPNKDEIKGLNGEYLVFQFKLTDKTGNLVSGIPLVWRAKGDNNTKVQKTNAQGLVNFWEPVGALPNSLATRKSKWGKMLEDMTVKATVNLIGETRNKVEIKIRLYQ